MLKSREIHDLSKRYLDTKALSREGQIVVKAIADYYARDATAKAASPEVVAAQLDVAVQNPKHRDKFKEYIHSAAVKESSPANVAEFILRAKREELAGKLAVSLANRDGKDGPLLEEYRELQKATSMDDLSSSEAVILDSSSIRELITEYVDTEGSFQLYPKVLSDRLGGRLREGHHVITFAPPETGKTALAITAAAGFCMQGRKGIYWGNEDKNQDMYFRIVSCLTGMTFNEVVANPNKAIDLAVERGIDNLTFIGLAPGDTKIIERHVDKYGPEWGIVDQLINLNEGGDGLNVILGKAAGRVRGIGKRANMLMYSVCQGGDSASGKSVLKQGDVYMSNTEVPGHADLLIGIGANEEQLSRNERVLTPCKNKISGDHTPITVRIMPQISRYTGIA